MSKFNFCGPSYSSQSLNADAQATINWYPEQIESGDGNTNLALYPTPGLKSFATGAISGPVGIQNTRVTVTSAQIKAANVTPVLLIPAPTCPNRAIVPLSLIAQLNFNSVAYTTDPNVTVGFGTTPSDINLNGWMIFLEPSAGGSVTLLKSSSNQIMWNSVTAGGQASGAFNSSTHVVNQSLYWANFVDISSDPGNSSVTLNIQWIEVEVTTGKVVNGNGNAVHGSMTALTAANLASTSVFQLVAAQGANLVTLPVSMVMRSFFNTTYSNNPAAVGWGTTWTQVGGVSSNAFALKPFFQGNSEDNLGILGPGSMIPGTSSPSLGGFPINLADLVNQPISFCNFQSPEYTNPAGGGDSTATLYVQYIVVNIVTGELVQAGAGGGDVDPSFATLSTAQINAAFVTPVPIAPAPGANLLNVPLSYVATSTNNGTPYADAGIAYSDSVFHGYNITGISLAGGAGVNYFIVAGDQTLNFASSTLMTREQANTSDNNHVYTIVSSTFTGGNTHIVVTGAIPSAYADTGGIPLPVIGPGATKALLADNTEYMLLNTKLVNALFTQPNPQILIGTPQIDIPSDDGSGTIVTELVNQPISWTDVTNLAGNTANSTGAAMSQFLILDMTTGQIKSQSSTVSTCGSSATGITRGQLTISGRSFAVIGNSFNETLANGTLTNWGAVANDALPVTMAASPQQLLLASAGTAYVFDLALNTLTAIPGATFSGPVSIVGICDDFFIAVIANSKEFYVSAPLDANDWVTNGSAIVSVFPDNIVSMIVDHREIFFASDTKSVWYYDSGNVFPFDVVTGGFVEAGSAAKSALVQLDNTIFWLGADERGTCVVWRGYGYTPQRVSNHAIEFAMQGYSRVDDAVSFAYQDQGHQFYVIYFPTPSKTWVYDTLTQMWHERGFWLESIGQYRAAHYWNHTFNFGKHLVGDWQSGNIYQMHIPVYNNGVWDFADDAGNPIRRVRRSPHISSEQKRMFLSALQVYLESGLGPNPPLTNADGSARGPQMTLRWSTDSAHTWSNEYTRDCGQSGEYRKRVRWLRLGRSRDRIFEISCSDPIPWRVVDSYLELTPGTGI